MAALSKDRNTTRKESDLAAYGVAAGAKIFAGSMVCLDAAGYAAAGADTAGLHFVGVAREYVDNTAGADGDRTVLVRRAGVFDFAAAGMAQNDVGAPVFIADDQTVAKATTNGVGCGIITEVESATKVWIDIGDSNRRTAQAQADSAAADVATLKTDFNALLAKLRAARLMGS